MKQDCASIAQDTGGCSIELDFGMKPINRASGTVVWTRERFASYVSHVHVEQ